MTTQSEKPVEEGPSVLLPPPPSTAVVIARADGVVTGWDAGAQWLYGYTATEMLGHPRFKVVCAAHRRQEEELFDGAVRGSSTHTVRSRHRAKSGAELDVWVAHTSLSRGDVLTTVRVVNETWLDNFGIQELLEAAPDGMVCVDSGAVVTRVNQQALDRLGYQRSELLGRSVDSLLAPGDRHRIAGRGCAYLGQAARLLAHQAPLSALRKDGSVFPVDISIGSVAAAGGEITTVAFRDVTERVAVQEALRESETRLRQLAETVAAGFVLREVNPSAFLYASPYFEQNYGFDPVTELTEPEAFMARIHPDDRDAVAEQYCGRARAGQPAQVQFRITLPDHRERWIHLTTAPVESVDGVVRRVAMTAEDITSRKSVEVALRSARADAESANAAKNEFLSRMSHELRTPLNSILGFGQLLEIDDLDDSQQDAVRHILAGGRHLLDLINDILDIAKIESDRFELAIEPIPIDELVDETVQLISPMSTGAAVTVDHRILPGGDHFVAADRRRLRQVILNLLSNAVKYNHRGGRVEVGCELLPPAQLAIAFTDTGRGIRSEDLPRLFTPFDRLGAGSTGIEGTGVGLALSERLMAIMGGSLTATSSWGKGSTFTATIPLAVAETGADATSSEPGASDPGSTRTDRRHVLLYIEDNLPNVDLMRRLLARRAPWEMVVAGEGRVGLHLAVSISPDLILLDLHLPDMNGIEVLRQLRADPGLQDIHVVVVSADASPHQVERLMAAGADGYLTKPLAINSVLELLDSIVTR